MSWFTDRHFFLLAVIAYGLSSMYSVFLWRHGFRQANRVTYLLLAVGFALHTAAMVLRGFSLSTCPVNNLYEMMTFVMWTIVACYLIVGVWSRLRFLGAFASPVLFAMGVFALMPALDVRGPKPEFSHGLASLHAALILLAYGAFGLSSIAALMYLMQEHDLKFHKVRAVLSLLPPITRLELVTGRLLFTGFVLLTAGLVLSPILMKNTYGVYYNGDPKIAWSAFVWVLYLALITMRWWFAQGGRRFAWGAIASFSFVLLTFWGFNMLSSVHHP